MEQKKLELAVLLQDLMLAFVINTAATILNGGFADTGLYLVGMFEAFCINYIAGIALPVAQIGEAAASVFPFESTSFAHRFFKTLVINAIFVTIISFTIALLNHGLYAGLAAAWWATYPVLHLVGLVTSLLIEQSCVKLAETILS